MQLKRFLVFILAIGLVVCVWVAWNWPRPVDMAQYAPADSIIFLECNHLPSVVEGIAGSNAWNKWAPSFGFAKQRPPNRWLLLAASFGLGPAPSVILSRAQVAVVMLNLDASEESATLNIKPEGAMIIETHTSAWRSTPVIESALQRFAERMYGAVSVKRFTEDADYLEWDAPAGDRKIVAAINGTLVVIGNSKRAVQKCLETRRKPELSLREDVGLRQMRARLGAEQSLTFGYVSAANAARLVSWATPLLFGRAPGDSSIQQIVARNAARVLGAIGWSSRKIPDGIEDHFFLTLEPSVVSSLRPAFTLGDSNASVLSLVPARVDTVTIYRSRTPLRAWEALREVAGRFDALSAVFFASVMKSALLSYGIENPDKFLNAVGPDLTTVRLNSQSEGAVIVARITNRDALNEILRSEQSHNSAGDDVFVFDIKGGPETKFAWAFNGDYLIVGAEEDVRACLEARKNGQTLAANHNPGFPSDSSDGSAAIVTYTNDGTRLQSFFAALQNLIGGSTPSVPLSPDDARFPFAITETRLDDSGLDRRTHSPFGQFSTLAGLLKP